MADEEIADPRLASPIWEGRYEVTPSAGVTLSSTTVMLTKANQCQFCGDAEGVTAGTAFATLPEECRPERVLRLPVCVGGSGSESVSLEGTVTIEGQTATGTVSVPGQTASGTVEVQSSKATGTVSLSSDAGSQTPMLVSGEFDAEGELVSAYSMVVVNNTSPLEVSGGVSVTVPSQSAGVSVTVPETQGEASIEIAKQEVPVTVSGTIATGGLATLTIGTDGTMTCSSGGTVYLDGFSYHICDRWY